LALGLALVLGLALGLVATIAGFLVLVDAIIITNKLKYKN
jgi:hypothetical protein